MHVWMHGDFGEAGNDGSINVNCNISASKKHVKSTKLCSLAEEENVAFGCIMIKFTALTCGHPSH